MESKKMDTHDIVLLDVHQEHFGSVQEDICIGINLLTVFLRKHGYRAMMFRGFAHETMAWLETTAHQSTVRSIGFYCDYENMALVSRFCRKLKQRYDIPVFVGGPQSVGLGEAFLRSSGCDAVVRGDGEYPLLELLNAYLKDGGKREHIDGIVYLDASGTLVCNAPREPIRDLDALPWPDFSMERTYASWSMLPVITGRGCPYSCAFCYEGSNSRKVRFRSVADVLAEIEYQFEQNPRYRYIFFLDDTFTLDPRRVDAFCDGLSRLRERRDFVWFCEGHIQNFHRFPNMAKRMVSAGLAKLFLGIESGTDAVLKAYGKRTTTAMIESVVEKCVADGVSQLTGNIIIGGPWESDETLARGTDFVCRLLEKHPGRVDAFGFFLIPYPNTAIARRPQDFGIRLLPQREAHSLEDIPMGETDTLSWSALIAMRNQFNQRILEKMKRLFEEGRVPHDTVLDHYRLARDYGAFSRWYLNVLTADAIRDGYYRLISKKRLLDAKTAANRDLYRCHPQRVFELWNTLSFSEGHPKIDEVILSPFEYQLMLFCSGKLRLEEVMLRLYQCFGHRFKNRKEFEDMTLQTLVEFERHRWIGYAPF